jgi:hypothetical protein
MTEEQRIRAVEHELDGTTEDLEVVGGCISAFLTTDFVMSDFAMHADSLDSLVSHVYAYALYNNGIVIPWFDRIRDAFNENEGFEIVREEYEKVMATLDPETQRIIRAGTAEEKASLRWRYERETEDRYELRYREAYAQAFYKVKP